MLNNHPVKTEDANRVFEVLTSEARLNILKLLVKLSADGLPAGGGGSQLAGIPKTSLSCHLRAIDHRGLASMTATQEVGQAVRGIQEGTKKNIQNVDSAGEAIEKAATLSVSSGESLDKIMELVNLVNDQVQSIATASEEQSAASEEINRAVEQVASISAETAQAMFGVHHRNTLNAFCLVDDLMEPLRPVADAFVVQHLEATEFAATLDTPAKRHLSTILAHKLDCKDGFTAFIAATNTVAQSFADCVLARESALALPLLQQPVAAVC